MAAFSGTLDNAVPLAKVLSETGHKPASTDAADIAAQLDHLAASAYFRRQDETGRRRLRELLPKLLSAISTAPTPSVTPSNVIEKDG